jgi:nucleotide-binding universal stress UspA family protein
MEELMYRHILIPTDGSELAESAVKQGVSLAKSIGAKVTALVVETPFFVFDVPYWEMNDLRAAFAEQADDVKQHATRVLRAVAEIAKKSDVPCNTLHVVKDHPYEAIIATANDNDCDLIVMASHGRSGIAAVVLGSVTAKVLTHTKLPVLVCH